MIHNHPLVGAGLPVWLPDGAAARHAVEEYLRALVEPTTDASPLRAELGRALAELDQRLRGLPAGPLRAAALASMVDAVILVVRAGVTQRRDLVRAKAMLDKVRAPVVGAVLNRVSSRETRRYYRSYSGYYGVGEGTSVRRRFRSAQSWWPIRRSEKVG